MIIWQDLYRKNDIDIVIRIFMVEYTSTTIWQECYFFFTKLNKILYIKSLLWYIKRLIYLETLESDCLK
jgi:hypothetical protein